MGKFFKGWRRKTGLVMLAMAMLLMVALMRSYVIQDNLKIVPHSLHMHAIVSESGRLTWLRLVTTDARFIQNDFPIILNSSDNPAQGDSAWYRREFEWYRREVEWRLEIGGFDFGAVDSFTGNVRVQFATVPHCSLILPLTLLSAWLILIKPRKAKPATGSTP